VAAEKRMKCVTNLSDNYSGPINADFAIPFSVRFVPGIHARDNTVAAIVAFAGNDDNLFHFVTLQSQEPLHSYYGTFAD
jgi:hypothetical protein